MKNHNENASKSQQISELERQIKALQAEQQSVQARIKKLLFTEDIKSGITFQSDIFTLQQSKLRMDTEIQLLQARIGRLKISEQIDF